MQSIGCGSSKCRWRAPKDAMPCVDVARRSAGIHTELMHHCSPFVRGHTPHSCLLYGLLASLHSGKDPQSDGWPLAFVLQVPERNLEIRRNANHRAWAIVKEFGLCSEPGPPHRRPVRNKDHVRGAPSNQIGGSAPAVFYNMTVDRHPGPPDLPQH